MSHRSRIKANVLWDLHSQSADIKGLHWLQYLGQILYSIQHEYSSFRHVNEFMYFCKTCLLSRGTYMNCYCYICPVKLTQRDTMYRTQVAFWNTYSTLPNISFRKGVYPILADSCNNNHHQLSCMSMSRLLVCSHLKYFYWSRFQYSTKMSAIKNVIIFRANMWKYKKLG